MLPHGSYYTGDTVVETRLHYAVPRAATLQDARCEAVATVHVSGPATPPPPPLGSDELGACDGLETYLRKGEPYRRCGPDTTF